MVLRPWSWGEPTIGAPCADGRRYVRRTDSTGPRRDLIVRPIRRLLMLEVAIVAIYEFECSACGERFEVTRPMSEHDLLKQVPPLCPKCGAIGARERAPLINTKPPSS